MKDLLQNKREEEKKNRIEKIDIIIQKLIEIKKAIEGDKELNTTQKAFIIFHKILREP